MIDMYNAVMHMKLLQEHWLSLLRDLGSLEGPYMIRVTIYYIFQLYRLTLKNPALDNPVFQISGVDFGEYGHIHRIGATLFSADTVYVLVALYSRISSWVGSCLYVLTGIPAHAFSLFFLLLCCCITSWWMQQNKYKKHATDITI